MIKQVHLVPKSLLPIFPLVIVLFFGASGCTFISSYDQPTETGLAEIQKEMATIQVKLQDANGPPVKPAECAYDLYKSNYENAKVQVLILKSRAEATSPSGDDPKVKQLNELWIVISDLQENHRKWGKDCMSQEVLDVRQRKFDSSFQGLLLLELAKKRVGA